MRVIGVLVAIVLLSCAPRSIASASSPFGSPEEIVIPLHGQTATAERGQTIRFPRPADFAEWQIDYAADVLKALMPPDRMRSPGNEGWRFEVIARGDTDVVATPIVTASPGRAPPPQFRVTIRVQ